MTRGHLSSCHGACATPPACYVSREKWGLAKKAGPCLSLQTELAGGQGRPATASREVGDREGAAGTAQSESLFTAYGPTRTAGVRGRHGAPPLPLPSPTTAFRNGLRALLRAPPTQGVWPGSTVTSGPHRSHAEKPCHV